MVCLNGLGKEIEVSTKRTMGARFVSAGQARIAFHVGVENRREFVRKRVLFVQRLLPRLIHVLCPARIESRKVYTNPAVVTAQPRRKRVWQSHAEPLLTEARKSGVRTSLHGRQIAN